MNIPLQVSFRDMEASPAVEEKIREKVGRLERYGSRITACRVVLEQPHHRHAKGNLFHVRVEVDVPGHHLVVARDPQDSPEHTDAYLAIRDAFNAMERQLKELSGKAAKKGRGGQGNSVNVDPYGDADLEDIAMTGD